MSIIAQDMEDKCRRIASKATEHASGGTSPARYMAREMALVLDHIDTIRKRHADHKAQLREKELEIGTQILNTEERIDLIPNRMERMHLVQELKQGLDGIMTAVQRLEIDTETGLRQQQTQLLKLWNFYDQLSIEHGDPDNTE